MIRKQERLSQVSDKYSYLHCFESLTNIREVLFLMERFVSPRDPENNEYVEILPEVTYDRASAASYGCEIEPESWSINMSILDEYVSGSREVQFVVGKKTKFCAFHVAGYEQDAVERAAKGVYRLLRKKYDIPSEVITVFDDGEGGYYVMLFFHKSVVTTELERFQNSVVNASAGAAMNCGANVCPMTKQRAYVPLPFGVNPSTKRRRTPVDAHTFKPIHDLRKYASSHIALSSAQVEVLLAHDFDTLERNMIKPAEWHEGRLLNPAEYPATINLTVAETECIRRQSKKSIRMLLMIMMMCMKSTPTNSTTDSITASTDTLSRLSGLSLPTVKSALSEMCAHGVLAKGDISDSSVIVDSKNKGPKATTYMLGNAVQSYLEGTAPCSNCLSIPACSVMEALYRRDETFFESQYTVLMATGKAKQISKDAA